MVKPFRVMVIRCLSGAPRRVNPGDRYPNAIRLPHPPVRFKPAGPRALEYSAPAAESITDGLHVGFGCGQISWPMPVLSDSAKSPTASTAALMPSVGTSLPQNPATPLASTDATAGLCRGRTVSYYAAFSPALPPGPNECRWCNLVRVRWRRPTAGEWLAPSAAERFQSSTTGRLDSAVTFPVL